MKYYKQRDSTDCGPACLAMIIKSFGRKPNLDKIRNKCALGKEGASLLGISRAAESLGFNTIGGKISFEILKSSIPLPCILHWNQNHFVVAYKIKTLRNGRSIIFIADPAKGLVQYSEDEIG